MRKKVVIVALLIQIFLISISFLLVERSNSEIENINENYEGNSEIIDKITKEKDPYYLQSSAGVSLTKLWEYTTGNKIRSSPVIGDLDGDNKLEVLIGSWDNKFYVLNGEDGSEAWNFTTGDDIMASSALGDFVGDETLEVIMGSGDGILHCLNGTNGSEIWHYDIGIGLWASPSLGDVDLDGKLEIVAACNGYLHAINAEDGTRAWRNRISYGTQSSPTIGDFDNDNKLEIVMGIRTYDDSVITINGEDGNEGWSFEAEDWVDSSPALGDVDNDGLLEVVFGTGTNEHKIFVVNGEDGSEKWNYTAPEEEAFASSPALGDVDNDNELEILFGGYNNKAYALNGGDGSILWEFEAGDSIYSSMALGDVDGDGKLEVVFGCHDNKIYVLNGEDGSESHYFITSDCIYSSPALGDVDSDGIVEIVVGSDDGKIYALKSASSSEGSWQAISGDSKFNRWQNIEYQNNAPNKPYNPIPYHEATGTKRDLKLNITVFDSDFDPLSVYFYNASDNSLIGMSSEVPSGGTVSVDWNDLSEATLYYWYVNVSDGEYMVQSDIWYFTTGVNAPPNEPNNLNPLNNAENVGTSPLLSVIVSDPDLDSMNVYFYNAHNKNLIGTIIGVSNEDIASIIWIGLNENDVYYWYVNVSDGEYMVQSDTWTFNASATPYQTHTRALFKERFEYLFTRAMKQAMVRAIKNKILSLI